MKSLMRVLLHPVTQFNLLIIGFLSIIQIIHTHAHYKMEMDVHAYCKNNMEYNNQTDEY
ncbi:hypothetical protein CYWG_00170 [Cyanophage S-SSM6b]|nr:hypothetical protein CYWG_00170 [Cyanophage S-SSM6b]